MLRAKRASFGSLPSIAQTAVPRFDVVGGAGQGLNGSAGSASITASLGADVFLDIWTYSSAGASGITSASCNGVAMTRIGAVAANNADASGFYWRYRAAGAGTGKSIGLVWGMVSIPYGWWPGQCFSVTGVTNVSAAQTAFGTGTALSQTVTASSGLIVQGFISAINNPSLNHSAWTGGTFVEYYTFYGGPHSVSRADGAGGNRTFTTTSSGAYPWAGLAHILT